MSQCKSSSVGGRSCAEYATIQLGDIIPLLTQKPTRRQSLFGLKTYAVPSEESHQCGNLTSLSVSVFGGIPSMAFRRCPLRRQWSTLTFQSVSGSRRRAPHKVTIASGMKAIRRPRHSPLHLKALTAKNKDKKNPIRISRANGICNSESNHSKAAHTMARREYMHRINFIRPNYSRLPGILSMSVLRTRSYASCGEKAMSGRRIRLTSPRNSGSCIFSSRLAMNCL